MPIGGFCPQQSGSVPGGLPVTKKEQKTLAAIKKQLDKVLAGATVVGATVVLVGSAVPHPAIQLGTKLGGGAIGLAVALGKAMSAYADPFDANYGQIAEPQLGPGPQVTSPPVPEGLASAVNALSTNSVQLREATLALLTALNRAQSAQQRGDGAAQAAQLLAVDRFAELARGLFAQRPALRRRVADALPADSTVGRAVIDATRRRINRQGLPDDQRAILAAFGAPSQWITDYGDSVAHSARNRRTSAKQLFTDNSLDACDRLMATYLHRLARYT